VEKFTCTGVITILLLSFLFPIFIGANNFWKAFPSISLHPPGLIEDNGQK
jgi:hypothetical protein